MQVIPETAEQLRILLQEQPTHTDWTRTADSLNRDKNTETYDPAGI